MTTKYRSTLSHLSFTSHANMMLNHTPTNVPVSQGPNVTTEETIMEFTLLGTVAFYIVFLIIAIGSVVGNLLVIISFKNDRSLRRRPTNTFLASLAVTDFFTGLVAIPAYMVARTVVTDFTCSGNTRYFLFFPGMVCGVSSVTHLSLIAIDRYIAVSRPLSYPGIVTKRRCIVALIIGGIFSIIVCSWPAFSMGDDEWFCGEQKTTPVVSVFVIGLCLVIILFFGVMIYCYTHMIRTALNHVRLRRTLSKCAESVQTNAEDARSRLRATVTVAIIMGAFIVCWVPIIFKFMYSSFSEYSAHVFLIVQVTCEIPFYANSMINPIIYGYRNAHYRVGYLRTLHGCCPRIVDKPPDRVVSTGSHGRPSLV